MAQPVPHLDLISLSSAILSTLEQFQEILNEADRFNHNHGDHMLAMWELIEGAVQDHPEISSEQGLALAAKALANCESNGSVQAYRAVLENFSNRYAAGSLKDTDVIELSRRLLHEQVEVGSGPEKLGDVFSVLLQGAGKIQQLRQLAEQLGAGGLFDSGLAMLAGNNSGVDALGAGVALIVQNSPLSQPAHRARSAELVLRSLLLEVDRQTWGLAGNAD